MKLQFIALSFVVIGCFQLLDVDGSKKAGSVSIDCIYVSVHTLFVTRHTYNIDAVRHRTTKYIELISNHIHFFFSLYMTTTGTNIKRTCSTFARLEQ